MGEYLETTSSTSELTNYGATAEPVVGTTVSESPVTIAGYPGASSETAVTPKVVVAEEDQPTTSAIETLYNQNRAMKEKLLEQDKRLEALERKIPRFEAFMIKLSDSISSFFRPKGVNITNESENVNTNVSDEASYMETRPDDSANNMEAYKMEMRKNGYTEDEINKRVATITGARPFEGGYNLDPENQSKAPQEEISMEDYYAQRPTFTDWQKEQIANAGGVTPEVAQASSAMRERMNTEEKPKAPVMDRIGQAVSQAFKPQGVNMDSANQIKKEDFSTIGSAIDAKATDRDSAQALVNMYYGSGTQAPQR